MHRDVFAPAIQAAFIQYDFAAIPSDGGEGGPAIRRFGFPRDCDVRQEGALIRLNPVREHRFCKRAVERREIAVYMDVYARAEYIRRSQRKGDARMRGGCVG